MLRCCDLLFLAVAYAVLHIAGLPTPSVSFQSRRRTGYEYHKTLLMLILKNTASRKRERGVRFRQVSLRHHLQRHTGETKLEKRVSLGIPIFDLAEFQGILGT